MGSDSLGAVQHVGVYTSVSFTATRCDGVTAGPTGCKALAPTTCNNLICASKTSCKTSCASDADCVSGYSCSPGGNCVAKLGDMAPCTTDAQCASGICITDNLNQGPFCRPCRTGVSCPTVPTTPTSQPQVACGDDKECDFSCLAVRDSTGCNADGSFKCSVELAIPPNGPDCDATTQHFHCGALSDRCPGWMVCASGTCKVTGGQRCISNSDCYSGSCLGSKCQANIANSPCIGDWDGECTSNSCIGVNINATQFKSVCM
jgi:hypothetical protein